jgi:hypothetical protein
LATIVSCIRTGVMERDPCVVHLHGGTGDVIVPRRNIISKVNYVPSARSRWDRPISIGEIGNNISLNGIQQHKMNFDISTLTLYV